MHVLGACDCTPLRCMPPQIYPFILMRCSPCAHSGGGPASIGGQKAVFKTGNIKRIANEIATDELQHVQFLRAALGAAAVPMPLINM